MLLPHFSQRGAKFSITQQHLTPQGPKGLGPGPHATLVFSSPPVAALLRKRPLHVLIPRPPSFPSPLHFYPSVAADGVQTLQNKIKAIGGSHSALNEVQQ